MWFEQSRNSYIFEFVLTGNMYNICILLKYRIIRPNQYLKVFSTFRKACSIKRKRNLNSRSRISCKDFPDDIFCPLDMHGKALNKRLWPTQMLSFRTFKFYSKLFTSHWSRQIRAFLLGFYSLKNNLLFLMWEDQTSIVRFIYLGFIKSTDIT